MADNATDGDKSRRPGRPPLPLLERRPFYIFREHRAVCAKCKAVVLEKPATLALACLPGSRMIKDAANFAHLNRPRSARA